MTAIIYKRPRPNRPDFPTHAAIPPMNIYFHFYYQEIKIVAVHRSVGHLNIREDLPIPILLRFDGVLTSHLLENYSNQIQQGYR